jgi:hypothetical protein
MSPRTILRINFVTSLVASCAFGAWLCWAAGHYLKGDFTLMWALGTELFAALLAFDIWKVFRSLE